MAAAISPASMRTTRLRKASRLMVTKTTIWITPASRAQAANSARLTVCESADGRGRVALSDRGGLVVRRDPLVDELERQGEQPRRGEGDQEGDRALLKYVPVEHRVAP